MILSLDTNVLIELANGRRPIVRERLEAAVSEGHQPVTCSLSAIELYFGVLISGRPSAEASAARAVLGRLTVADFTDGDARVAAELRVAMRRAGSPIGAFDTLIAGQALNRQWTVVTANTREFARVPGLAVIDWTRQVERR